MKIGGNQNEISILKEIGQRIKDHRISLNITQSALADKCGISPSTEVRIENGEDSKFSNYIKILSALNMLDNLNIMIPEVQPDFKSIYEEKPKRKRATPNNDKKNTKWVWEEDK